MSTSGPKPVAAEVRFAAKLTFDDATPGSDGQPHTGFAVWTGSRDKDGYGQFDRGRAHRFALARKLGRPIAPGMLAMHSCDYPPCVDGRHLSEGRPLDNSADRDRKGRSVSIENLERLPGELNGRHVLTAAEVRAARVLHSLDPRRYTSVALARALGVSQPAMHKALKRINWRHLL